MNVEQRLRHMIGDLFVQIAALQTRVEELVAKYETETKPLDANPEQPKVE